MFKLFRMFDPARAVDLLTTAADIDALTAEFPVIGKYTGGMKVDLPKFMQLGSTFATNRVDIATYTKDVLRFYRQHSSELVNWSSAARAVFAISPSSAASERVFSLLKCMFPEQRSLSLSWIERPRAAVPGRGRTGASEHFGAV